MTWFNEKVKVGGTIYQIIGERLMDNLDCSGNISIGKVHHVLGVIFHLPKIKRPHIIQEFINLGVLSKISRDCFRGEL
jgi:hypothetical protein